LKDQLRRSANALLPYPRLALTMAEADIFDLHIDTLKIKAGIFSEPADLGCD
jgi:hypothetical protein